MSAPYPALCPRPSSKSKHFNIWHGMLADAHVSAAAFLDDFKQLGDVARSEPTDEKDGPPFRRGQEILRVAIVVASAGLEAALKEALRSTLDALSSSDKHGADRFESWVRDQLFDETGRITDPAFLAHALTSQSPRDSLAWGYVASKVRGSLQSQEKLCEVVRDFGFDPKATAALLKKIGLQSIRDAFECRNAVIHEYDWCVPTSGIRTLTRRLRTVEEITSHVNTIFLTGEMILSAAVEHVEKMQRGQLSPPTRKPPRKSKRK